MNINDYADNLLSAIDNSISDRLKTTPTLRGAIVSNVNTNGTVDVYLPPERTVIFTNLLNQTPFELKVGDSVELLVKDGSYSNCWVVAKHQATYNAKEVEDFRSNINQTFQDMQDQINNLQSQINDLYLITANLDARVTALEP